MIIDGILEEELHTHVIQWLRRVVNDALQHEVGLLQLAIEEQVSM